MRQVYIYFIRKYAKRRTFWSLFQALVFRYSSLSTIQLVYWERNMRKAWARIQCNTHNHRQKLITYMTQRHSCNFSPVFRTFCESSPLDESEEGKAQSICTSAAWDGMLFFHRVAGEYLCNLDHFFINIYAVVYIKSFHSYRKYLNWKLPTILQLWHFFRMVSNW